MKITLPATIATALTLLVFPALSLASSVEPTGSSGHIFENNNVDFGMRTGLVGMAKVIDKRSILVQSDGVTKGQILVVTTNKNGLSQEMQKAILHNEVHIEGRAQILSVEKLEERSGIDLDNKSLKKYEGKTVVIAETIDLK